MITRLAYLFVLLAVALGEAAPRPAERRTIALELADAASRTLDRCGAYEASGCESFVFTVPHGLVRLETSDGEGGCPGDTPLEIGDGRYPTETFYGPGCYDGASSYGQGSYTVNVCGPESYVLEYFTSECSTCGNGIREAEDCDGSGPSSCESGPCTAACGCPFTPPLCGNAFIQPSEQCDDGNTLGGDGCDSKCQLEPALPLAACGSLDVAGELRVFSFALASDDVVRFETSDGEGGCPRDTRFEIHHADGSQVGADLDSGIGRCSRVARWLPAGTYELRVFDWRFSSGGGGYVLGYFNGACSTCPNGLVEAEACDDGNVVAGDGCDSECEVEPQGLAACASVTGTLDIGNHVQFSMSLASEDVVDLRTDDGRAACFLDYAEIRVLDLAANIVAESEWPRCARVTTPLPAGDYLVELFDSGAYGIPYVLHYSTASCSICGNGVLEVEECDDANVSSGDGCDASCRRESPNLDRCGIYESPGFGPEGFDEFKLALSIPHRVKLATGDGANGCSGNSEITILNERGESISGDDDSGIGQCAAVTSDLESGAYRILVRGSQGIALGPYVLSYHDQTCSTCGNGVVELEECDDGNLTAGDECSEECQKEIPVLDRCGAYEFPGVDPGNLDEFSFSLAGDDVVRLELDDGSGGCAGVCVSYEGQDGQASSYDEDCDGYSGRGPCARIVDSLSSGQYVARVREWGNNVGGAPYVLEYFTGECSTCGNGVLEAEECDDGNLQDGDGCDSGCRQKSPTLDNCGEYASPGYAGSDEPPGEFPLTLVFDDVIRLDTKGRNGGCPGETHISLHGVDSQYSAFGKPSGVGGCARLIANVPAGDYGVVVFGESDEEGLDYGVGPYVLEYFNGACSICGNGIVEAEECDDGDRIDADGCDSDCTTRIPLEACAASVAPGFPQEGSNQFVFVLDTPQRVQLETAGTADGCPWDTFLEVYTSNGELIASDDQGGEGACSALTLDLESGVYRVVVSGFNGDSLGAYVLRYTSDSCSTCGNGVTELGEECDDRNVLGGDGCDTACAREPLLISHCGQTRAWALSVGQVGEFTFTPDVSGQYVFETTSLYGQCPWDTTIEVYAEGNPTSPLAADNDGGAGACSKLVVGLESGRTYQILVREFNGGSLDAYVLRHSGSDFCGTCGDGQIDDGEDCDDADPFFRAGEACNVFCENTPCGQPLSDPATGGPMAADALYALQSAVGVTACDSEVCDVDGSGTIVATDSRMVLLAAVGLAELTDCSQ